MTTVTPRTRGTHRRLNAAIGLTVFLTLAGTGAAQASWTTDQMAITGAMNSGGLSATQSGFPATNSFNSSHLTFTNEILVTNTSAIGATPRVSFSGGTGQTLATGTAGADAASVTVWQKPMNGACDTPPNAASSWSAATLNGTAELAATTGKVTFCVKSSITQPQRFKIVADATSLSGPSATVTARSTVTRGDFWTANAADMTLRQNVESTITPAAPTATTASTTQTSLTINWTAPADAVGVNGYTLYRDNVQIKKIDGTTTFSYTDGGLTAGTNYRYMVRAFTTGDVAGAPVLGYTESPSSLELTAKTLAADPVQIPPTGWRQLTSAKAHAQTPCLALNYLSGVSGTWFNYCDIVNDYQKWTIASTDVVAGVTLYSIQNKFSLNYLSANLGMKGYVSGDTEKWKFTSTGVANQFTIQSVSSAGNCLTQNGTQAHLKACDPADDAQKFTVN